MKYGVECDRKTSDRSSVIYHIIQTSAAAMVNIVFDLKKKKIIHETYISILFYILLLKERNIK